MAEIKLPREKGSTIVDDDGKIWTLRGKKRNRGIAPKGYEFYRKADATVGMRRAGVRQQATEFERSLKGLTPEQREELRILRIETGDPITDPREIPAAGGKRPPFPSRKIGFPTGTGSINIEINAPISIQGVSNPQEAAALVREEISAVMQKTFENAGINFLALESSPA